MDVNRANFLSLLPEIESNLNECDFVAIDTELTGLRKGNSLNLIDTQEERFRKLVAASLDYSIIQFGLSCFQKGKGQPTDDGNDFTCRSYNFYIYPYKVGSLKSFDRSCMIQASSLEFLIGNGFDFNKLIKEGINWLNWKEEEEVVKHLKNSSKVTPSDDDETEKRVRIPEEHSNFVNGVLDDFDEFMEDDQKKTLNLPFCSAYRRKLLYESLKQSKYANEIHLQTCSVSTNTAERYIAVTKTTLEEKAEKEKQLLAEAVGFSKVIKMLILSKKPVVGHNLLLDIMHTIHQFVSPLKKDYDEFKTVVKDLFPVIYDTKLISLDETFKELMPGSGLDTIYERLSKEPFDTVKIKLLNDASTTNKPRLHEAGFDSYVTGVSFIKMASHYLSNDKNSSSLLDNKLLSNLRSKINLLYSLDIPYLNLCNDDVTPNRSNVFHVTFPSQWTNNNLYQLFSVYGYITVAWIDDTSAFVALKDEEKSSEVKKAFRNPPASSVYKIASYNDFVMNSNRQKVTKSDVETKTTTSSKKRKNSEDGVTNLEGEGVASEKETKKAKAKQLFDEDNNWP